MTASSLRGPRALALMLALLAAVLAVAASSATAVTDAPPRGISKNQIIIGGSFPFSGPLAVYGALSEGAKAYFGWVNAHGGVNGRKIKYVTLDDGYDPSRLASNARNLIEQQNAFLLLDFGGPANAIRDYMQQVNTIQMNMSGLHDEARYTLTKSWWPDIRWEAGIEAAWAAKNVSNPKVGLLAINNDLALDFAAGINRGLGSKKSQFVSTLTVSPAQVDVSSQLNRLRAEGVNTLFVGLTGATMVGALKYIRQTGWKPTIFVYSAALALRGILDQVGEFENLYSAMWLKDPADPRWAKNAGVNTYKANVAKYSPDADPNSIFVENGYAGAVALVTVLKQVKNPTTASVVKAWNTLAPTVNPLLMPNIKLSGGPQGRIVHQYQVVNYANGTYKSVGKVVTIRR
ncbi:MAG: ABC transporter substrate-binding protein [Actinobacteria bacterium]|nr:ABC transporter substrate-binding protein [Actinomycetota bacterium]